jgi:hypothetical protein
LSLVCVGFLVSIDVIDVSAFLRGAQSKRGKPSIGVAGFVRGKRATANLHHRGMMTADMR